MWPRMGPPRPPPPPHMRGPANPFLMMGGRPSFRGGPRPRPPFSPPSPIGVRPARSPNPGAAPTITATMQQNWDFLNGWIRSYDKELPAELIFKCKPLFCELCSVKMNSAQQAKMHYEGKVHEKHSKHFLSVWAQANKCPAPKLTKPVADETVDSTTGGIPSATKMKHAKTNLSSDDLYCQTCDLSFTSQLHANQHFNGRNHARKSAGLGPLRSGYFNKATGKWQRNPPENSADAFDAEHEALVETVANQVKGKFFCDACKVGATSQQQLDMHLTGKSHRLKMQGGRTRNSQPQLAQTAPQRAFNPQPVPRPVEVPSFLLAPPPSPPPPPPPGESPPPAPVATPTTVVTPPKPTSSLKPVRFVPSMSAANAKAELIKNQLKIEKSKRDFSAFRTPSGQYYCANCNLSLNSEVQFFASRGKQETPNERSRRKCQKEEEKD